MLQAERWLIFASSSTTIEIDWSGLASSSRQRGLASTTSMTDAGEWQNIDPS
jgi:hypothetical protein